MPSHVPAITHLPAFCVTTPFHSSTVHLPTCQVCPSASNGPENNACSRAFCIPALPHSIVHMPVSLQAMVQCCHVVTLACYIPMPLHGSMGIHVQECQVPMPAHGGIPLLCACHFTRLPSSPSGIVGMPVCMPIMSSHGDPYEGSHMVTHVYILVPGASQHHYLVHRIPPSEPSVPAPMYRQACLQGHKACGSAVHLFPLTQSSRVTA